MNKINGIILNGRVYIADLDYSACFDNCELSDFCTECEANTSGEVLCKLFKNKEDTGFKFFKN